MKLRHSCILGIIVLIVFLILPVHHSALAGSFGEDFIDPSDGKYDMGPWLAERKGLMPAPILITEPAVGYGGGLALVYFHGKLSGKSSTDRFEAKTDEKGRIVSPSVSGAFGGGTENGSWFAGAFHRGIWKNDTIRYTGALAETYFNLKFYGLDGGDGILGNNPVEYTMKATFLLQKIQFRIFDTDLFAGGQYLFMDTRNQFDVSGVIPGIPDTEFDIRAGGFSLFVNYDSRDNSFTPNRGWFAEIKATNFNEAWGGDDNFNRYQGTVLFYHDVFPNLVLGLRGEGNMVDGDAPFFANPFIQLRGVKAMRYQGEKTLLGEAELRWDVTDRWSLIGFGGVGTTFVSDDYSRLEGGGDGETVVSKGLGFRYFIAKRFGLRVGVDLAWSDEDTAVYLTIGNSWAQ